MLRYSETLPLEILVLLNYQVLRPGMKTKTKDFLNAFQDCVWFLSFVFFFVFFFYFQDENKY